MSFLTLTYNYAAQINMFSKKDWLVYVAWVGLMMGLCFSTLGFLLVGHLNGVSYPPYVWNIPVGAFIFSLAISFDTIGHRTTYKEELEKGEALVHHVTIFNGITSILALCLAYHWPSFLEIPALVLLSLSVFYSIVDEAMHWRRYLSLHSDPVEMWSHVFIFVGHMIMIFAWWKWFKAGYPGVAETVIHLPLFG